MLIRANLTAPRSLIQIGVVCVIVMTALGCALPAHGQYALCDTTVEELQQRLNNELQRIAQDFQMRLEQVHKRFSDGLTADLAKIERAHEARMSELAARQAALEGDHFEKFIPMIRINMARGLAQWNTRREQSNAQAHWAKVYHQEKNEIRISMQDERARYEGIYREQIAFRRKTDCP